MFRMRQLWSLQTEISWELEFAGDILAPARGFPKKALAGLRQS